MKHDSVTAIYRTVLCVFMLAGAFSLTAQKAQAQSDVPQLVNYQGILTDPAGNPLPEGNYNLALRIYSAPTGGNLEWLQSFSGVPAVNGYFNVNLGNNIAAAFDGKERFMEIEVGSNPAIQPRQQILSVPYAMVAETLEGSNVYVNCE